MGIASALYRIINIVVNVVIRVDVFGQQVNGTPASDLGPNNREQ